MADVLKPIGTIGITPVVDSGLSGLGGNPEQSGTAGANPNINIVCDLLITELEVHTPIPALQINLSGSAHVLMKFSVAAATIVSLQ